MGIFDFFKNKNHRNVDDEEDVEYINDDDNYIDDYEIRKEESVQ